LTLLGHHTSAVFMEVSKQENDAPEQKVLEQQLKLFKASVGLPQTNWKAVLCEVFALFHILPTTGCYHFTAPDKWHPRFSWQILPNSVALLSPNTLQCTARNTNYIRPLMMKICVIILIVIIKVNLQ